MIFSLMIWLGILTRLNFYRHVYNTSNSAYGCYSVVVIFNKRVIIIFIIIIEPLFRGNPWDQGKCAIH